MNGVTEGEVEKVKIWDPKLITGVTTPPISPEKLSTKLPSEVVAKDLLHIIRARLKEIEAAVDKLEKAIE